MINKIAVIGSGISGLVSAYLLSQKYSVHLFESEAELGGHTHTVQVYEQGKELNLDCGFLVFNKKTYPNFLKILDKENIHYQKSDMSFGYYSPKTGFFYNGHSIKGLLSHKKNRVSLNFYNMLYEIIKFNKLAKKMTHSSLSSSLILKDFLQNHQFSRLFIDSYLLAISSAVWSCPKDQVLQFPLSFLFSFYDNHGLLNLLNKPQWYAVKEGSKSYIPALIKNLKGNVYLNHKVQKIVCSNNKVIIHTNSGSQKFDAAIIATHSDQALKIIDEPTEQEINVLSKIRYQSNQVTLHSDISVLPPKPSAWASWNYYEKEHQSCSLTYYLNRLQSLNTRTPYFVSVNLDDKINHEKIIKKITMSHPVYTSDVLQAQQSIHTINNKRNLYFCGAYWGNGFHEDGVVSAINACAPFGVSL